MGGNRFQIHFTFRHYPLSFFTKTPFNSKLIYHYNKIKFKSEFIISVLIMATGINFSIDTPWIKQLSISLVVHQNMKHKIIITNLTCEKSKHLKVKVVEES